MIFCRTMRSRAPETFILNPAAARGSREQGEPKLETLTRPGDAVRPVDAPECPARPTAPLVGSQGCKSTQEPYGRAAPTPPATPAGKQRVTAWLPKTPQREEPCPGWTPARDAGHGKSPAKLLCPAVPSAGAVTPATQHPRPRPALALLLPGHGQHIPHPGR